MININLLPPELKLQRIAAKRNASLISICIVAVLIVAILGIISQSLKSTVETYLSSTKNNIKKESDQIDQYQELQDLALFTNDRWQTTQEIEKNHVYWSQVLQELSNCAPTDVQFENLVANSEKSPNFILQGNTTTEREIIKFKDKLEASPFFKNIAFKSSSLSTDQATTNQKLKFTLEFDLEQKKVE
ncbi:MAG: PilN domain-containing protein [Patescibacteria group bacterium]|nr:PilN domain-containing protein [Patescibacteria group bacterium]